MREKTTPYLRSLSDKYPEIALQYQQNSLEQTLQLSKLTDPLGEDEKEVVKGLVHKYDNRALIKVSHECAAHCRFCTRYREIGETEGRLTNLDIHQLSSYIQDHSEINDVILSGGDPLYTPKTTIDILETLAPIESIKVFRIGTRLPIHNPKSFTTPLLEKTLDVVDRIGKDRPFFLLLNFQHPAELTKETLDVLKMLRSKNVTLLAQTVFLKGVNNSADTLKKLFEGLYPNGVIPYYIFRCDYVKGVERFICDIEEEKEIMTEIRSSLSGIACPTYVIDVPGHGKIPVPLNYWEGTNVSSVTDFKGTRIDI